MTDKRLEEIRTRYEKATPWQSAFIAHAREDIPYLLSQIALRDRALDWLGEVSEDKRECGGYPAVNWALHAAAEELAKEQQS
jgi:hypothetical protein